MLDEITVVDFSYSPTDDMLTFFMSDRRTVVIDRQNLRRLVVPTAKGIIFYDIQGDGETIGPTLFIEPYLPAILKYWPIS